MSRSGLRGQRPKIAAGRSDLGHPFQNGRNRDRGLLRPHMALRLIPGGGTDPHERAQLAGRIVQVVPVPDFLRIEGPKTGAGGQHKPQRQAWSGPVFRHITLARRGDTAIGAAFYALFKIKRVYL